MINDRVAIKPDVGFLKSIRADAGQWWVLAAEGIDNAFDFAANSVRIVMSASQVQIADNGLGITRERELAIVRLGEHKGLAWRGLGRFGVGLKYNAMSAGDLLEVASVSVDGRLSLEANWEDMLQLGEWEIARPRWSQAGNQPMGTTVTIKALRWRRPTPSDIDKVREQLAAIFRPALATERSIQVNGARVAHLREPRLRDVVETTIHLPSGKVATVRGGVLVDVDPETSPLYMVNLVYQHRVIDPKSAFGTRGYSGLRRMFADVTLIDGPGDEAKWGLRRFKDGLADPDADLLAERVGEVLRPILEQCHAANFSTTIEEMTDILNSMLPGDLVGVRPPHNRNKDKTPGSGKRRRHPHGPSDGPEHPTGPARKRRRSTIVIEFDGPLSSECGYGRFVKGQNEPSKIILAKDNPDIAEWLQQRDRQVAARAIYAVAMMIYEHARETSGPQAEMTFDEPFGLRVWRLAEQQKPNLRKETA